MYFMYFTHFDLNIYGSASARLNYYLLAGFSEKLTRKKINKNGCLVSNFVFRESKKIVSQRALCRHCYPPTGFPFG